MRRNGASRMRIAVWDRPLRLIHWLFVILIPLAWWTAEEDHFEWHFRIGIVLLILLVFRLVWGFIGSSTARFANFMTGPRTALAYIHGHWRRRIGHNPLGGWSVAALLIAMSFQVGLGLFATDDDGLQSGPLNHLIGYETAEQVTELHEFNFNILLALIAVHIGAILFYAVMKREDLIRPMVTGMGTAEADTEPMKPAGIVRLIFAAAIALAVGWWIDAGAPF